MSAWAIANVHMVIGPNESDFTETIPPEHIATLCRLGILQRTEVVDHGPVIVANREVGHVYANIYRRTA